MSQISISEIFALNIIVSRVVGKLLEHGHFITDWLASWSVDILTEASSKDPPYSAWGTTNFGWLKTYPLVSGHYWYGSQLIINAFYFYTWKDSILCDVRIKNVHYFKISNNNVLWQELLLLVFRRPSLVQKRHPNWRVI